MEKQNYRKIELGDRKEIFSLKNCEIISYKLENYKNIFISSNCHIKPRGLHVILKHVSESLKEFDIKDITYKIIIFSYKDGPDSFGAYDAIYNVVYLNEVICDMNKIAIENIKTGYVERHEIWHLKQAENYKNKFNLDTIENYDDYIVYTRVRAKKFLDSLGINDDNVGDISDYAYSMFFFENYDEVEAEIKAKKGTLCTGRNFQKKSKT